MDRRQPLPQLWLMTDERQGDSLWQALERLPRGGGIVFRHYSLDASERAELFRRVKTHARQRGLVLVVAGSGSALRGEGVHGRDPQRRRPGIRTAPVHHLREIRAAERAGADLLFLSPAFPTRSHPRGRTLGPLCFRLLARQSRLPVIALGGMNAKRARRLRGAIYGWAAIDAWT